MILLLLLAIALVIVFSVLGAVVKTIFYIGLIAALVVGVLWLTGYVKGRTA